MEVVSRSVLPVTGFLWQPRPDVWTFTVVCKATFHLAPGESPLAEEQQPIVLEDRHRAGDPSRSLAETTDLLPYKKSPEVLVLGHAHAPGGAPVSRFRVRLSVGSVDKTADIHGDRFFDRAGQLSEPSKVDRMRLSWERAAGGPGTLNPAGMPMGEGTPPKAWGGVRVPNIVPAGARIASRADVVPPVGFGPIAPTWPTRAARLPRHAGAWSLATWQESALPEGIDPGIFNSAPDDQHLTHIPEDDPIVLEGLSAEHPVLTTRLQRLFPRATARRIGQDSAAVALRADTLLIDTDARLLTVTYRGHLPLDHPAREGWIVVTMDRPRARQPAQPLPFEEVTAMTSPGMVQPFPPAAPSLWDETTAITEGDAGTPPAPARPLPFSDGATTVRAAIEVSPAAPGPAWLASSTPPAEGPLRDVRNDALPFQNANSALIGAMALGRSARLQAPAPAVIPRADEMAPAVAPGPVVVPPPPPFVTFPREGATPLVSPQAVASFDVSDEQTASPETSPLASATPALVGPITMEPIAPDATAAHLLAPLVEPPALLVEPPALLVEPPALLVEPPAPLVESPALLVESPAPAMEPAAAAPERVWTLSDLPIEKCARLDASIACRPAEKEAFLSTLDLSPGAWAELRTTWEAEIKSELRRGKKALLRAYDEAYVAQLEQDRGPITPEDYARIAVGMERGDVSVALRDRDLPEQAAIRIQRSFIQRLAADPATSAAVRSAMARARSG